MRTRGFRRASRGPQDRGTAPHLVGPTLLGLSLSRDARDRSQRKKCEVGATYGIHVSLMDEGRGGIMERLPTA